MYLNHEKGVQSPGTVVKIAVRYHMGTKNGTQIVCKHNEYCWPQSCLSSPKCVPTEVSYAQSVMDDMAWPRAQSHGSVAAPEPGKGFQSEEAWTLLVRLHPNQLFQ